VIQRGKNVFPELLEARAEAAAISLNSAQIGILEAYFDLLKHWNKRINLTALPLDVPTDASVDRLFIEPLAAAEKLAAHDAHWFDLGSGGGSPAIPMKTLWPGALLTMVESKSRKAAFLREAIRVLHLVDVTVSESRFEDLATNRDTAGSATLVTVRAVRLDASLFVAASSLLKDGGRFAAFSTSQELPYPPEEDRLSSAFLTESIHKLPGNSTLTVRRKYNP
jgi:16S rRNA (guanine527-N7)-methyltransferase